jgi:glycosyltransferase involved in cell wall biosynthesis
MGSSPLRERIPWAMRSPVRRARNAVALAWLLARQLPRWWAIAKAEPQADGIAVSYGRERMPTDDLVYGGHVKFVLLERELSNRPRDFNVLYLGSSSMPLDARLLVGLARRRGAVFAWNQNGVAYRGWYGDGWRLVNRPRAKLLHEADYVFFQSEFCRLSADRFYGPRRRPFEILHNPVDTRLFTPAQSRPSRPLTLLLGGNQYQRYRVEVALETLAHVRPQRNDTRLLIAGALSFAPDGARELRTMPRFLELRDAVELIGPYTQAEAPELMRRADILLHTKYNDPCPTVVLEAMAAGLPVAYSASGGTPELVGDDAGIGVPAPLDWERDHPPSPAELAEAVLGLAERLSERSEAARARALGFEPGGWVDRHRTVFAELLDR